jgi:hypothetical protein
MGRVHRRRCGRSWKQGEGDCGERGDGVRRKGEGASPRFSPRISIMPLSISRVCGTNRPKKRVVHVGGEEGLIRRSAAVRFD